MGKILAVDFDGTICKNAYPNIGAPYNTIINGIKARQKDGWKVILWTCRVGDKLDEAVKWCEEHGLIFDAINDNVEETIRFNNGLNPRKVWADEYVDDHNVTLLTVAVSAYEPEEEEDCQ